MNTIFKPSSEQTDIAKSVFANKITASIARAGSGKTRTVQYVCEEILAVAPKTSIIYLTFGEKANKEATKKLPKAVVCKTFHAIALAGLKKINPNIKIDFANISEKQRHQALRNVGVYDAKLITFCKHYLADTESAIQEVNERKLEGRGNVDIVLKYFNAYMKPDDLRIITHISYDDLIYHAGKGHFSLEKYHFIILDEAQDASVAQWGVAKQLDMRMAYGSRWLIVGDPNQSIMGFQGSDVNYFLKNISLIDDKAKINLSMSYRLPTEIVRHIQKKLSLADDLKAAPNHVGGIIEHRSYTELGSGDVVLCPLNAPLIALAKKLIAQKKAVSIIGIEDYNKILEKQISIYKNIAALAAAMKKRLQRSKGKDDEADTITSLLEGCKTLDDVKRKINQLTKAEQQHCIVLSTVHKYKGLENPTIWILEDDILLNNPYAVTQDDFQQMINLAYVAYSRVKYDPKKCGLFYIKESFLMYNKYSY